VQAFDTQNSLCRPWPPPRVDAGALTNISLNDVVSKNPSASVEVTKVLPVIDARKTLRRRLRVSQGDETFVNAFNAELKKLHDSGEWLKIAGPFASTRTTCPRRT